MALRRNLGQAEVEDFNLAAFGDENVGGLHIAMDYALGMGCFERLGDLDCQRQKAASGERAGFDEMFQSLAVEILHRDEGSASLFADVIDRANIAMVERACGARLTLESNNGGGIGGKIFREKL